MFKFALYYLYPVVLIALLATGLIDQWVFACLFVPVLGLISLAVFGLWVLVDLGKDDKQTHVKCPESKTTDEVSEAVTDALATALSRVNRRS